MSWKEYVNAYLVNYIDQSHGKAYLNACEHGALVSNTDGTIWASSPGFTLGKYTAKVPNDNGSEDDVEIDEFKSLKDAFDNNGVSTLQGGVRINHEKHLIVSYDPDKKVMYLKKNGGGGAVARSGQAFAIATFSSAKKIQVKANGQVTEMNQNPGVCNTGVEKLAEFLLSNNL